MSKTYLSDLCKAARISGLFFLAQGGAGVQRDTGGHRWTVGDGTPTLQPPFPFRGVAPSAFSVNRRPLTAIPLPWRGGRPQTAWWFFPCVPLCSPAFIQHLVGVVFNRHKSKKVLKKVDFFRFFLLTYDVGGLYNLGHDSGAKWVAVSQSGRISPRP